MILTIYLLGFLVTFIVAAILTFKDETPTQIGDLPIIILVIFGSWIGLSIICCSLISIWYTSHKNDDIKDWFKIKIKK